MKIGGKFMAWIAQNLATILVLAVVIAVCAAIIIKLIRDKKQGKSNCSCGCGCSGCPSAGICHGSKNTTKEDLK